MILDIRGKLKPYYVQTLAMIFFPGVKFPEGEAPSPNTPEGTVILDEDEREVRAAVTLRAGGRETAGSAAVAWDSAHGDRDRIRKMAAGEAFMRAGEAMTGIRPPWGMLTGVRPAKVASELLDAGLSPEEAADAIAGEYGASIRKARLAVDVSLAERRVITPEVRRACSVYVGIPFCPTRCAYCSFVSYASPGLLKLIPEYLEALMADIDGVFGVIRETGMRVASAYIGGGTPTILSADQLKRLLSKIREHADGFREFTLEAGRPDTITKEKLAAAAEFGVTRVSVNTQTLNGDVLAKIGRAHTPGMFREAYAVARESGIRDINVDLIAGLPYDTAASFRETVDGVVALDPENVTVHTFSVKKSSDFKAEGRFDPASAVAAESTDYAGAALPDAGYLPYYLYRQKNTVGNLENVGYAKPGHEGLYNIYMMEEVHSIFASGASAVTKFVSVPKEDGSVRIERIFQPKYPYEYLRDYREDGGERKRRALSEAAAAFFGEDPQKEEP